MRVVMMYDFVIDPEAEIAVDKSDGFSLSDFIFRFMEDFSILPETVTVSDE
jgi:hypothetical protein